MSQYTICPMPWTIQEQGEDGAYNRDVFFVTATAANGRRFAHFKTFHDSDDAFKLAEKMIAKGVDPIARSEYWTEMQPVYGSSAYERAGGDMAFDKVTFLAANGMHREAELEAQYEDSFR